MHDHSVPTWWNTKLQIDRQYQSNSSMHHYECVVLCKDISLQRGRFCARSLASYIPGSNEDRSFKLCVAGRPGGCLQFPAGGSKMAWLASVFSSIHYTRYLCGVATGDSCQPMTGWLATHPSSTMVKIRILTWCLRKRRIFNARIWKHATTLQFCCLRMRSTCVGESKHPVHSQTCKLNQYLYKR